ncbi:MAG: hypothetical protein JOZ54_19175 [Acidobacteria bacterium]|nr:hypothetical protein [Acidobacteriota bacterium]
MTQKKSVLRKIGKYFAFTAILAVVGLTTAHFVWKYSGSNQWELWQTKNGVSVYTMKVPGATRLQFKVTSRIHAKLAPIVAVWTDTTTEGCRNFLRGCTVGQIFKPFDEQSLNYVQAYRLYMPKLSKKPVAMALKMQLSRDPQTEAIQMEVSSMPELLPKDGCCINMGAVHNVWRVTPIKDSNDMVEFEFRENDDPGIPYYLYNRFMLRNKMGMPRTAERVFNMPRYQSAEFAFLNEPAIKTATNASRVTDTARLEE